ncbi:MAG: tRNA (adenosine(37)-N6)-threonylcarbamoyltransferase complex transferase subunit TsaD [Candidatus Pacebacteria bacterium]|nr:tRNA (adenosine(37)-N6)-threonylcarbamoyltransferase complex transferase subunit TsaD [Candidatus Paceibacterota bacterium]
MRILAIETSCDETAISVVEATGIFPNARFKILSNIISSQIKIHAKWGGVVPTLAKREHQKNLVPVLVKALKEAGLLKSRNQKIKRENEPNDILKREDVLLKKTLPFLKKYGTPKIDAIAITHGPGLEPALWVGINFAKALSFAWNKPIIPINHMEGHFFSAFLQGKTEKKSPIINFRFPKIKFPAVALLVSGGHTEIVLIKEWLKYKLLGQTRDDAAGEAFDKAAKMLELGYPGGPAIAAAAGKFPNSNFQIPKINLPRPMLNSKDFDFSFSGLKTSLLYKLKEFPKITEEIKISAAYEFQNAAVEVLIAKTLRAAKENKAETIILGGGVAANSELRKRLASQKPIIDNQIKLLIPEIKFTGDNAAMIALAGYAERGKGTDPGSKKFLKIQANGNLKLS